MNVNDILKMAHRFEQQVKKASLKGNMAKRILFSLLSHLVPINESARIALTKGVVDYNALKQMIPGAKELIEYGVAAAIDEASYSRDDQAKKHVEDLYKAGDIKNALIAMIDLFNNSDKWELSYGGSNWAKIAKTLLTIKEYLDAAEQAKKENNVEEQMNNLMQMTSYVNVLDGLAHNTGSIMDKMLSFEMKKTREKNMEDWKAEALRNPKFQPPSDYYESESNRDAEMAKLVRMMDSKELTDPDDILQEILPTIESESDAPLTMKDWVEKARKRRRNNISEDEYYLKEERLKKIREKKYLQQQLDHYTIHDIKAFLQKLSMMPDNRVVEEIIKNRSAFFRLRAAYAVLQSSYYVSKDALAKMSQNIDAAQKLTAPSLDGTKYKQMILLLPNSEIKSLISKCYSLTFELENALDTITENL